MRRRIFSLTDGLAIFLIGLIVFFLRNTSRPVLWTEPFDPLLDRVVCLSEERNELVVLRSDIDFRFGPTKSVIKTFDLQTGSLRSSISVPTGFPEWCMLTANQHELCTWPKPNQIVIGPAIRVDRKSGTLIEVMRDPAIKRTCFSPSGALLARRTAERWEIVRVRDQQLLASLDLDRRGEPYDYPAWSPDEQWLSFYLETKIERGFTPTVLFLHLSGKLLRFDGNDHQLCNFNSQHMSTPISQTWLTPNQLRLNHDFYRDHPAGATEAAVHPIISISLDGITSVEKEPRVSELNRVVYRSGTTLITQSEAKQSSLYAWLTRNDRWQFIVRFAKYFPDRTDLQVYRSHGVKLDRQRPAYMRSINAGDATATENYLAVLTDDQLIVCALWPVMPTWLFCSVVFTMTSLTWFGFRAALSRRPSTI